jgi:hypothetical protein
MKNNVDLCEKASFQSQADINILFTNILYNVALKYTLEH